MSKLPVLKGNELVRILEKMGFQKLRQGSSHVFMQHPDGRVVVVPIHSNEDIDRGLLNKIIKKDLLMPRDEFLKHIK